MCVSHKVMIEQLKRLIVESEKGKRLLDAVASASPNTPTRATGLAGSLRSFVIETGDRMSSPSRGGRAETAGASGADGVDGADPRLALFPYAVIYTPLRVSFESTFEAAGNVLWQLRDLPTTVEIRSATLTRGLPLMTIELLVRVLQRGGAIDAASPPMPIAAAPSVGNPTAPRLVPSAADLGAVR